MPLAAIAPTTTRETRCLAAALRPLSQQRHAKPRQADPGVFSHGLDLVRRDLVQNSADDFDASLVEESLVERDLVDGPADAPGTDEDDLGVEEMGDAGVGEVEDAAHAGMAGALDEGEVLLPGHAVEGAADFVLQDREHGAGVLQVAAGEAAVDRHGAHALDGHPDIEDGVEEMGVLVDLLALHLNEALADGLDESDPRVERLEGGEQAETDGRLAVVHARGGDEQAARHTVGGPGQQGQRGQQKRIGGGGVGHARKGRRDGLRRRRKAGGSRWPGNRRWRRRQTRHARSPHG